MRAAVAVKANRISAGAELLILPNRHSGTHSVMEHTAYPAKPKSSVRCLPVVNSADW